MSDKNIALCVPDARATTPLSCYENMKSSFIINLRDMHCRIALSGRICGTVGRVTMQCVFTGTSESRNKIIIGPSDIHIHSSPNLFSSRESRNKMSVAGIAAPLLKRIILLPLEARLVRKCLFASPACTMI